MTDQKNKLYLKSLCYFIPELKVPFELDGDDIDKSIEEAKKILSVSEQKNVGILTPILSNVTNSNSNLVISKKVLSLKRDHIFPTKENELKEQNLVENLISEVQNIKSRSIEIYTNNFMYLLQCYTSNLPEPSGKLSGVSLFDFIKVFAATATSIFQNKQNGKEQFSLFRADVSGIQDYIFSISSKYAAKNLKGRSFYIQLLSDSILQRLLGEFGLYNSNVIYNSGGNFFLLTHQLDDEQLSNTIKEINHAIRQEFNTSISVVFGCVNIDAIDFEGSSLNQKIEILFQQIDLKKKQKHLSGITNDFDSFFNPEHLDDKGGSVIRDAITGEEFGLNEIAFKEDKGGFKSGNVARLQNEENPVLYKLLTKKQIELGKLLKDTTYWVISYSQLSERLEKYEYQPAQLGVYHYFLDANLLKKFKEELYDKNISLLKINSPDFVLNQSWELGNENTYGFTLYGGQGVPTFEGDYVDTDDDDKNYSSNDAKTFNHLAFKLKAKNESQNEFEKAGRFHRLGILRMDVDGLGWLFKEGLKENEASFSNLPTYAAISRSLDTFFIGYLNSIWESGTWETESNNEIEYFKNYCQIIYAGGDDLFVVGRWDACIAFAQKINEEFKAWIGYQTDNPSLSISGGIAVLTHKFPIIKGAEFAGEAEKMAKEYHVEKEEQKKNAITLWKPLHWEWEYPKVVELKERVAKFMNKKDYKSVFQRLLSLYEIKNNQQVIDYKFSRHQWKWQLSYNLARASERYWKDERFCEFLKEMEHDVFCETYKGKKDLRGKHKYFDLLQIAIKWADLENRTFNYKKINS